MIKTYYPAMPLLTEPGHDGWWPVACPECGRERWNSWLMRDLSRHEGRRRLSPLCADCAWTLTAAMEADE